MPLNILPRLFCTLALLGISSSFAEGKTDEETELEKQEALEERLALEQEIKGRFSYSFNDIAEQLVTVSCSGPQGRSSGSGFVATLDGKTYLFTNQHVILGAETISFKTATGRLLRPRSVELAARRDIARLLLQDTEGLRVSESMQKEDPVGVFGNSEGGGVATELYGKVTGITPDKVEVSADFVSGNSGSPVLNLDQEVIGIASYVSWKTDKDDETVTRRFCYRLTDEQWGAVNWKKYNEKYGKLYIRNERLIDSIFDAATIWYGNPFSRMSFEDHRDAGLRKWADEHNRMINRIERTMDKRLTQRELNNVNKSIRRDMFDSAEDLSEACRNRAHQMQFLAEQKELTGFLRNAFERLAARMNYAAGEIEEYGSKLAEHNYFYFESEPTSSY
ncbi:trypsin-like peptidase domain-containing protein [Pontiella agarivorans]|uniref:Trypsin-like peptidase domain-containing protein n=1 Tax=Pontiella agarivorans TaxID=3038953 RepID=A0ABU5MUP1_9BACT|nr:trypsin-like peptidase domain-containing protein [Pontiella agarivorans]MDZ8117927.1 trypsin-like peptidase domain-containing protein [Pontiella agarivorans]